MATSRFKYCLLVPGVQSRDRNTDQQLLIALTGFRTPKIVKYKLQRVQSSGCNAV
jgi:hypothetical protein